MSKIKSCYNCQWANEHPPIPPSHLGPGEPGFFTCGFMDGSISTDELDREIGAETFDCLNWMLSFEELDLDNDYYLASFIADEHPEWNTYIRYHARAYGQ